MTSYILHVSLLLGLGFLLYQVLLKKETFYSLNRVILVSYLVLAFSLPLIHIPQEWSLRVLDKEEATYATKIDTESKLVPIAKNPVHVIKPIAKDQKSLITKVQSADTQPSVKSKTKKNLGITDKFKNLVVSINWTTTLQWTYCIGLFIFLINFLVQFSILLFYRWKYPILKDGSLTIVEMEGDKAPFSFLNMIYINPSKYDYDTYEQILAHEKIHITKWHSLDIFLSELSLIVLWFNPFAWLYRKAVEHNLEYLTDQEMLASGANAQVYQMNLLKVSVPELPLSLSTNYNHSFLKKRILMMNTKKSSARSTWKYLFILPVLALSIALFNPTNTTAQNDEPIEQPTNAQKDKSSLVNTNDGAAQESTNNNESKLQVIFDKPEVDTQPQQISPLLNGSIDTIQNANSIVTMTDLSMFDLDDEDVELSISESNEGIIIVSNDGRTFNIDNQEGKTIIKNASEDLKNDGAWEGKLKNGEVCLHIKKGGIGKNYYWNSSECFKASDFSPSIKRNSEGEFSLTRDPGTLVLKGEFVEGKGEGRYDFSPNTSFIATAKSHGYDISEKKLIHFFLSGIQEPYFNFLKSNGYTNIDEDDLLALAIHDVNEEYIKDINGEFKKANYDKPSVDELVALKIHDVDMEYVKSFGKELYGDLSVDQIVAAAIHDVDPKYISEFKALGYNDLTFDNLIAAAIHDVDIEYVKALKGAGFKDLTFDNLISAAIHDMDPEYITAFKKSGMDVDFDDMISASIHDIDVDYIQEFKDAGFDDLTFDDLVSAGIHDVDVEYLKEAKQLGFDMTFDQLVASSIHDIDIEFLKAFHNSGLKGLTFDNMISAAIHDIDPEFIKDFNAIENSNLTFENLISTAIHDVDIEFIKGFKNAGFANLDFDNYISAAIHGIEADYIQEINDAGIKNISFDDVISFGIHGIDTEDITGFKSMGFDLTADKIIEAGIHGVTPKFIQKMQDKGHKNLEFDEYIQLKIHGF